MTSATIMNASHPANAAVERCPRRFRKGNQPRQLHSIMESSSRDPTRKDLAIRSGQLPSPTGRSLPFLTRSRNPLRRSCSRPRPGGHPAFPRALPTLALDCTPAESREGRGRHSAGVHPYTVGRRPLSTKKEKTFSLDLDSLESLARPAGVTAKSSVVQRGERG